MSVLERFQTLSGALYIGGDYRRSEAGRHFDVIDPATEQAIARVADCTDEEIDEAIDRANTTQRSWNRVNMLDRAERLHAVAAAIRRLRPRLAEAMTREMGKPYKESADEVLWCATAIDYYAETARSDLGRVIGPSVDGQFHFTLKEPLGVVVSIQPFNYPLCLLAWQAAAALAAGNAVIVKPSELTSITTLMFMEAFATLPAGLMQCLTGGGRVGARLCDSPDTHMVAFTGGVETGRAVARACAERFKPTLIEASGNDPFIVMPSAPLDRAVRGAAFAAFLNCGQVCTSAERIYVHESIHDAFVERLVEAARGLRIGNGLDRVDLGPMVSSRERQRFEGVLAQAQQEGARVCTGGLRPPGLERGWFMEPTVLQDVRPDMSILNNESFGPVAPVCRVASFDEALGLANRSRYGLGATVYTSNLDEAMRAVREIEAGMVWINAPLLDNDAGPFGGRKLSGMGRELGPEGLETFRQAKLAMIDAAAGAQDFWWFPYRDEETYPGS